MYPKSTQITVVIYYRLITAYLLWEWMKRRGRQEKTRKEKKKGKEK